MFKFSKNKKRFLGKLGMTKSMQNDTAFTLVEMIVVIALIAILALIIFIIIDPAKMKQKANDGKVRTDVSQIAGALAQYSADGNLIPTGCNWITALPSFAPYFKDNQLPTHPCYGLGVYAFKFDGQNFKINAQLCGDTSKYYSSNGQIGFEICF